MNVNLMQQDIVMKVNAIKEKVFNFTEKFASRTGDYAIITKLTMEIKTFETKISTLQEKLGKAVYEKMKDDMSSLTPDEDITSLVQQINDLETRISNLNEEISEIRKKAEEAKKAQKSKETQETSKPETKTDSDTDSEQKNDQ